jgi:hypothetical protein
VSSGGETKVYGLDLMNFRTQKMGKHNGLKSKGFEEVEIILVDKEPDEETVNENMFQENHLLNEIIRFQNKEEALNYLTLQGKSAEIEKGRELLLILDSNAPVLGMEQGKGKFQGKISNSPVPGIVSGSADEDLTSEYAPEGKPFVRIASPLKFRNFSKVVSELGYHWMLLMPVTEGV